LEEKKNVGGFCSNTHTHTHTHTHTQRERERERENTTKYKGDITPKKESKGIKFCGITTLKTFIRIEMFRAN
jgi:hypothetical protein